MQHSDIIGSFTRVGLAWSRDEHIRFASASGGAVTSILMYLLDYGLVDAVLVPRLRVRKGCAYGVYEAVFNSKDLPSFSGSVYAPVFFGNSLRSVLNRRLRVAIVAVPCIARALRGLKSGSAVAASSIRYIFGLYCNNTPRLCASRFGIKHVFNVDPDDVVDVRFRGSGWPGFASIKTKSGQVFRALSPEFWDSGFGQYFYDRKCLCCSDQTAEDADVSFADPWTYTRGVGAGKTLVVVRTREGLEAIEGARKAGYIEFEELPSHIYAIQYTTLLKKVSKVTCKKYRQSYALPPSISTIIHELDYIVGSRLAKREELWPLLRLYIKLKYTLFRPLIALDYLLDLSFPRLLKKVSKAWK